MKNKIFKNLIKKLTKIKPIIIGWYYRRKFIGKQLRHLYSQKEENAILKEYVQKRILEGQTQRRKELLEKEAEEKEIRVFINYMKHL